MLETYPPVSPGRAIGLGLIGAVVLLDASLIALLLNEPISLLSFLWLLAVFFSVLFAVPIAYWTARLSAARYRVEDAALVIEWGRVREVVRLNEIRALRLGEELNQVTRFRGLRWPGYMLGHGVVADEDGRSIATRFYATRPLSRQVLVVTDSRAYGLSPTDPADFKACVEALQITPASGETAVLGSDLGFLGWDIWGDLMARITLGACFILNAALFAFLTAAYGRLPAEVPLHFSRTGIVDRTGLPEELLIVPVIGSIAWMLAVALGYYFFQIRHEKPLAHIVWGATVVIEAATWVAVVSLLT